MKAVTFYIADDGTQFNHEEDCLEYERKVDEKVQKENLREHINNQYPEYHGRFGNGVSDSITQFIWEDWSNIQYIMEGQKK